jgi:Rrf2 family protein
MKLSTRTRYGAIAMLELALNSEKGAISTKEIAARQQLSPEHLEHLLASLRSARLVRRVREAQGGHTVVRSPDQINLRDIYDASERTEGFVECTPSPEICERADSCVPQEAGAELYAACMGIPASTRLQDLGRHARNKQATQAPT